MKKTAVLAGLVAVIAMLGLSSCDTLYTLNVFKASKLGQFDASKVDYTNPDEVGKNAKSSPSFYSSMSTAQASQAVAALLPAGYSATASDLKKALDAGAVSADNLVLAATIQIKTTEAGTVIDNFSKAVTGLTTTGASGPDVGTIIKNILPADALPVPGSPTTTPSQAFLDIIGSMTSASASFEAIANSISGGNSSTSLPSLPVPGGSTQDTAFYAIASLAVASVMVNTDANNTWKAPAGTPAGQESAYALWAAVQMAMDPNTPAGTVSPVNFDTGIIDTGALSGGAATNANAPVNVLLSAAGIDLSKLASGSSK